MSINISPQKANENMIDFLKSSSTLSNSHSSQSIPKVPNKYKRSNSSSKINYLVPDPNANFVYFQPNDSDSYKISYLKKSYESRINKLLSNLKNCVSNLTSFNPKEVIDELVFVEKEKTIADLYEQNAILKNEYEETKNEMDRLQKVISVLEIDLNKIEGQLKDSLQSNKKLNEDISKFQAENFELNLKLKNLFIENDKIKQAQENIRPYIEQIKDYEATISHLKDQNEKTIDEFEKKIEELEIDHKNEIDLIHKENELKTKNLIETNQNFEETIKELNIEIELKDEDIKKLYNDNTNLISENQTITTRSNYLEQLIILLKAKISGIKTEISNLKKTTNDSFRVFQEANEQMIKGIIDKVKVYITNNDSQVIEEKLKATYEKHILDQFKIIEKSQKENKNLLNIQQEYIQEITILNNKIENLEIENKSLSIKDQKLLAQIEKANIQLKNKKSFLGLPNDVKQNIKKVISTLKLKYNKQIQILKKQVNELMISYKNLPFTNNNCNNNDLLVNQLQKKIEELKNNQEEYAKLLIKKDKKINRLQAAMSQSFNSISSGMKNIKIANLLDNEVKQFLKQTKEESNNHSNN